MRRREMLAAQPNAGHEAIAGLERDFEVEVLTQNVDDLHERAGSSKVTHLHGELTCLRSSRNPDLVVPIEGWEQKLDATAPAGCCVRIVFFRRGGADVRTCRADCPDGGYHGGRGTSLAVYPAASLVRCVRPGIPIYVVDPGNPDTAGIRNPLTLIRKRAAEGMPGLAELLRPPPPPPWPPVPPDPSPAGRGETPEGKREGGGGTRLFQILEIDVQQLLGGDERRYFVLQYALFVLRDACFDRRVVVERVPRSTSLIDSYIQYLFWRLRLWRK